MIKGYIDDKDNTLFVCPSCGFQKRFNVSPFKDRKKTLTIKCQCGESNEMQLEFRQYFRKQVDIPGVCIIEKKKRKCDIIIRDISIGGIGIEFIFVNKKHLADIEQGDNISVEFQLDILQEKTINKKCIVRTKSDTTVGAEFIDYNYTKAIGFYMME